MATEPVLNRERFAIMGKKAHREITLIHFQARNYAAITAAELTITCTHTKRHWVVLLTCFNSATNFDELSKGIVIAPIRKCVCICPSLFPHSKRRLHCASCLAKEARRDAGFCAPGNHSKHFKTDHQSLCCILPN